MVVHWNLGKLKPRAKLFLLFGRTCFVHTVTCVARDGWWSSLHCLGRSSVAAAEVISVSVIRLSAVSGLCEARAARGRRLRRHWWNWSNNHMSSIISSANPHGYQHYSRYGTIFVGEKLPSSEMPCFSWLWTSSDYCDYGVKWWGRGLPGSDLTREPWCDVQQWRTTNNCRGEGGCSRLFQIKRYRVTSLAMGTSAPPLIHSFTGLIHSFMREPGRHAAKPASALHPEAVSVLRLQLFVLHYHQ